MKEERLDKLLSGAGQMSRSEARSAVRAGLVTVDGAVVGAIEKGFLVLLGVMDGDTEADADIMAAKVAKLRVFTDENGQAVVTLEKKEGRTIISAVSDTETLVPPVAVVQTAETAPQTADFSIVFAAAAVLSLGGFALAARRKGNE